MPVPRSVFQVSHIITPFATSLKARTPDYQKQFHTFLLSFSSHMPIAVAENPSFLSCSTWSRIIDISGETTIILEFSKLRAALGKRGNS